MCFEDGNPTRLLAIGILSAGLALSLFSSIAHAGCPDLVGVADDIHGGIVFDSFVLGGYAYVVGEGFSVIDISDSLNLEKVGALSIDGTALAVDGLVVFVTNSTGLVVLDVSNPENPRELSSLSFPSYGLAGVTVSDQHIVVAEKNVGLHIIDVTDLSEPAVVGQYDYYLDRFRGGLTTYGPYVLLAHDSDFQVISIEDPTNPVLVGDYLGSFFWWLGEIVPKGRFIFVSDPSGSALPGAGGLQILNLADPMQPQHVGYYHPWPEGGGMDTLAVSGRVAILGGTGGGGWVNETHFLDVIDPTAPLVINILYDYVPEAVQIVGEKAYLWDRYDHLMIMNIASCYFPSVFSDGFESGNTSAWSATVP